MEKVTEILNKYLNQNDKVILGLSGGPDSMCLLSLLLKNNIDVIIAHVNHKVRKQADKEQEYIEKMAKNHNLIYECLVLESTPESDFESYARQKRYEFFNSLYEKYHAKYIITAHHGDDEIETILMRITRGSNLRGYAGIKIHEERYLRPLLCVSKEDILKYNKNNDVVSFNDSTNDEDNHTRNRFRHYALPFLKKENPNVHFKFLEFSEELTSCDDFINSYIDSLNIIKDYNVDINRFLKEHSFIQKKIIEAIVRDYQKDYIFDVSKQNINDILSLIKSPKSNLSINLKNGFIAIKNYNSFTIQKETICEDYEEILSQSFQNDMFIIKYLEQEDIPVEDAIYLSSSDIKLPLIIRNRRDGDVIEIKNLGHKKIKDLFIDNKVEPLKRASWPIITDSNNVILWVPNLKKSKFAKDKKEKYDIILSSERKIKCE